jgi:signal transduction histidine kinase
MSTNQPEPRRALSTKFLVFGFCCTFVLAALTIGIAAVETIRVEHATLEIADDSPLSTYYLGNVGEQLARLRSHIALGLQESPDEFSRRTQRLSQMEMLMQEALDAVPATLDPAVQQRWAALQVEVVRLRKNYTDAASAIRMGQPARASELLAREADGATRVHDGLDELQRAHRERVLAQLRSAHRNVSRTGFLVLILSGLFLAGMVAIWSTMIGTHRRQKQQLAVYTHRLESANSDLDAFAGRVAHDLKNALGPVAMGPSMIRRFSQDPTRVIDVADRMDRCSRKAIALVDALLAFSRAARKVEVGESEALPAAMTSVLEEIAPEIARLRITLEIGEIPDVRVRCSPGLLHIVLANLCGNSVKFLEGQQEKHIRISAHQEESFCRIEVQDTGPGIPSEALQKIFEPFYRVEGSRAPGTGIGLATVRRIVEQRGGRITVESTEGRGSRFQVWLPLAPPLEDQPPKPAPEKRPSIHH